MTPRAAAAAITPVLAGGATAVDAQQATLRFGILAGLADDPAPMGRARTESAKLPIECERTTFAKMNIADVQIARADSQDRPKSRVEGALNQDAIPNVSEGR